VIGRDNGRDEPGDAGHRPGRRRWWSSTCCAARPPTLTDLIGQLLAAIVTGATGMAPAVADLAGQARLPLVAQPDTDGWRLTGSVPWASNLFDDAVLVVPARTADGRRLVGMLRLDAPGVRVRPAPPLLALDATATGGVELDGVALPSAAVLGEDLAAFMRQAAMAVGVAESPTAAVIVRPRSCPYRRRPRSSC
jgi:alkylation response protein AidB-like acyl-CoA dehydrogenase